MNVISPTAPPQVQQVQAYELMIWPDQVSCFVPGLRCVILTSTACTFKFLGGTRHTLYVTSSPSTGTYSPSMSEMWTKMSSPPWEGWMKPWPCDLEKFLHTPLNTGPEWARTDLQVKRKTAVKLCRIIKRRHEKHGHEMIFTQQQQMWHQLSVDSQSEHSHSSITTMWD